MKKQICQDGSYYTSRMKDGFLYSFSIWQPEIGETFETSDLIPLIDGKELPATDICIPRYINYPEYILISSVDTANAADGVQNTKAMIASPEELYVSKENIYTLSPYYKGNHRQTEIIKFHYEKNEITGIASAVAKGYIDSSFSIDEYDGNLRVVTTYESADILSMIDYFMGDSWNYTSRKNGLFIYNEKLELIGTAAGLARNQEIKSARFMGNTAYFVTFENTDPLYSADLTDPESPKILGKLHIPGFSSYLHPFGENLLLGLGYDADEKNGQITGLKLSMFDTSDMKDVKETDKFVINGITYCSALDNYKAIFADKDKSLVGFYHDNRYMVFRYDPQEGFDRVLHGKYCFTQAFG
ncbi:MAG: beta-propeller domain-containing protein [Lachnospiraceae bacterium]